MAEPKITRNTFRFRLYPTKAQSETLESTLAVCCELYNAGLQERRDAWKLNRKSISYFDQTVQLTHIRKVRADVDAVNTAALENVLKRVDLAYKAFFRRVKAHEKPGYPRFRSVARYDSLTFRQIGNALIGNRLMLSKIGKVRIKVHRPLEGSIKTLTVKREAGRWFACFSVECEAKPLPFSANTVGIDVGLSSFATLSDGTAIENPRWYRHGQQALRVAQRRVARRKKGSHRRRTAVTLLQRVHARVRQQRADFLHKLSRKIVNENGLIAVEDLNIKGLARGILAKSVNDAAWSQFLFYLAYKAESAGRVFVKVDPRGTSQTCTCGATVRKTLKDRIHICLSCGLVADRDHVSALIIQGLGQSLQDPTWATAPCVS